MNEHAAFLLSITTNKHTSLKCSQWMLRNKRVLTLPVSLEWDDSGRKGSDGQQRTISKVNVKRKKGKVIKSKT